MKSITVLIASYNRINLLKESLQSALDQDYPHFDVLVVDDGSEKETRNWLSEEMLNHRHLKIIFRPHLGVAATRTYGVLKAQNELICILDSDDVLLPGALKTISEVFEKDPAVDLVYVKNRHYFPGGSTKVRNYPKFKSNKAMMAATWLMPTVPFKHSGTTFRRKTCTELGAYDVDLPCKIDIDLFLKFMAGNKKLHLITAPPLVGFNFHDASISVKRISGIRVWLKLIDRYGPPSKTASWMIKCIKTWNEFMKLLFMEAMRLKLILDKFIKGK